MEKEKESIEEFHPLPDLKERIIAVLNAKNLTYKQLVDYIGVSEAALDRALAENTIEIRTLELISKELRIPLYSFFRDPNAVQPEGTEQPYYNVNIWAPEQIHLRTENETLRNEIERLRLEIAKKELIVQGLEIQLKKNG
jgi:transcriptional regulator with XRE-family HTH domain